MAAQPVAGYTPAPPIVSPTPAAIPRAAYSYPAPTPSSAMAAPIWPPSQQHWGPQLLAPPVIREAAFAPSLAPPIVMPGAAMVVGPAVQQAYPYAPPPQSLAYSQPAPGAAPPYYQQQAYPQQPYAPQGYPSSPAGTSPPRLSAEAIGSAAVVGARHAGAFTVWLMNLACDIDEKLYGKRIYVFVAAAFPLSIIGPWLDTPRDKTWTVGFTILFMLVCAGMALAFVGSFRDEDGNWNATQAQKHAWNVLSLPFRVVFDMAGLPGHAKASRFGVIACGAGVVSLAFRNALELFAIILEIDRHDELRTLDAIGWGLLISGAVLWVWMWWLSRQDAILGHVRVAREKVGEFKAAIRHVPRIVDCQDREGTLRLAESMDHPLMQQLFRVLANWNPREVFDEKDCQYSLMRKLKKEMREAEPAMEVPLGERRRGDIVLGDAVLLEMKFNPNTGELDRADGQVGAYARLWAARGPVVFLLCKTEPQRVMARVQDIIARKEAEARTPVFAVFARR